MINVTAPVRAIRINAFGENAGSCATPSFAPRADGMANPRNNPPPTATPTLKKSRRETGILRVAGKRGVQGSDIDRPLGILCMRRCNLRGGFYCGPNAHIGPAATDVAGHRRIDIGVRGVRSRPQQRAGRHDLSRLAVAALHDLSDEPRLLHGGT